MLKSDVMCFAATYLLILLFMVTIGRSLSVTNPIICDLKLCFLRSSKISGAKASVEIIK
jgi:hypothetical protein